MADPLIEAQMEISETRLIALAETQDLRNEFSDHFIFRWREDAGHRLILVEPFTWAWLGIKICEGVIGAIGARLFNDLFGIGKVDFAKFNENFSF